GKSTVDKLSLFADEQNMSMWQAIPHFKIGARAAKALAGFVTMIRSFQDKASELNAFDLAALIARKSKVVDHLKSDHTPEGQNRLDNVQGLLDGIKEFVDSDELVGAVITEDKSLASYLTTIALHSDLDEDSDESEYVTLMSVHSAKGLEYRAVFVVGLEEDLFPSFMAKDDPNGMDEERRLFYVAITRAKKYLVLTFANSRYRFGQMRFNSPSRFLEEIHPDHLESTSQIRTRSFKFEPKRVPSGIQGKFSTPGSTRKAPTLLADPSTFAPAPSNQIEVGMEVLHLKFGKGKVLKIDGSNETRVATIRFTQLNNTEKRLVLKFAKLQIL
ncbi:MAG: ATP-binding domain-containing protein, partial [Saprospiraceae bacterium]|nr:ATP-binding domain-containing protein [Saprospiraceae bacterium]